MNREPPIGLVATRAYFFVVVIAQGLFLVLKLSYINPDSLQNVFLVRSSTMLFFSFALNAIALYLALIDHRNLFLAVIILTVFYFLPIIHWRLTTEHPDFPGWVSLPIMVQALIFYSLCEFTIKDYAKRRSEPEQEF